MSTKIVCCRRNIDRTVVGFCLCVFDVAVIIILDTPLRRREVRTTVNNIDHAFAVVKCIDIRAVAINNLDSRRCCHIFTVLINKSGIRKRVFALTRCILDDRFFVCRTGKIITISPRYFILG